MIIPFFTMNEGCPHRCIFCNVRSIAGRDETAITEETFRETMAAYLKHAKKKSDRVQVAFYGGNFTGMEKGRQIELLKLAHSFIREGIIHEIRVSTRPDCIDTECLNVLDRYGVSTVEIGAQSLVDEVLKTSDRGHSSVDVMNAVNMLKVRGFKTGIHLMAGLPGDSRAGFEYSVAETIALKPDTVRIHPTIVFKDTPLAELFVRGAYTPLGMTEAIDMCKCALRMFEDARIPVIRLGLQTTREMERAGTVVAGPFHPSFRSLVEESLYFDMAASLLADKHVKEKEVIFSLSPKDISTFRGHKNRNIHALKTLHGLNGISVSADPEQERGSLVMIVEGRRIKTSRFGAPFSPTGGNQHKGRETISYYRHATQG